MSDREQRSPLTGAYEYMSKEDSDLLDRAAARAEETHDEWAMQCVVLLYRLRDRSRAAHRAVPY